MASLKAELYDPDGLKAIDDESVGVISVSTTGRSILAGGGYTEAGLGRVAEASIQSQVGGAFNQIRGNLAQLGSDMDSIDITTSGNYWGNQIDVIVNNSESAIINTAVTASREMLAGAFRALDSGFELRVAVSNPLLLDYMEKEARFKAAVADFMNQHPLLDTLQLDIPSPQTIQAAFSQSAADGNLSDLQDKLSDSITHFGLGLPVSFTGTAGNHVTGTIGAYVYREDHAHVQKVQLNLEVKHWKMGVNDGFWLINTNFVEKQDLINNHQFQRSDQEGFNCIIGVGVRR